MRKKAIPGPPSQLPTEVVVRARPKRHLMVYKVEGDTKHIIDRPVMLCVLAVEELTRPPARVAKEYQYRRHTSPSLIGDMMFPEKYNADGHKVQGPKNGQGAALVAAKWIRIADKMGFVERYHREIGHGRHRTWSSGWKITDEGVKYAAEWAKHPWAVEWYKDRAAYAERRKKESDRIRELARKRQ